MRLIESAVTYLGLFFSEICSGFVFRLFLMTDWIFAYAAIS